MDIVQLIEIFILDQVYYGFNAFFMVDKQIGSK
jgi:hypothetical protein